MHTNIPSVLFLFYSHTGHMNNMSNLDIKNDYDCMSRFMVLTAVCDKRPPACSVLPRQQFARSGRHDGLKEKHTLLVEGRNIPTLKYH